MRPLAIKKGDAGEVDVKQLSRRHVIETDAVHRHVSIFGGKLTDCLNVGNEVSAAIADLGIPLAEPEGKWYGEPGERERETYFHRARALGIDAVVAEDTGEALSERLWRRYGADAESMLDAIAQDSTLVDPLVENAGIRRCEIDYLAEREMIVRLEDYLRRRSKIELLYSREELRQSKGLFEACEKLFGDDARQRFEEYFAD